MTHIKNTMEENTSWCGEILGVSFLNFYFKDVEHAIYNGKHGVLPMCKSCIAAIVICLQNERKINE